MSIPALHWEPPTDPDNEPTSETVATARRAIGRARAWRRSGQESGQSPVSVIPLHAGTWAASEETGATSWRQGGAGTVMAAGRSHVHRERGRRVDPGRAFATANGRPRRAPGGRDPGWDEIAGPDHPLGDAADSSAVAAPGATGESNRGSRARDLHPMDPGVRATG